MLFFVSGNKQKFLEIKRILAEYGIELKWHKAELSEDCNGSIDEIARHKAAEAYSLIEKPLIVEDTGIFFEGYHDFPGVRAKRIFEKIGYEGLLKMASKKSGKAYFKTAICFTDGTRKKVFVGLLKGRISQKVYCKNRKVMPYERIFVPVKSKKPLCMMLRKEKNKISHRARAAEKLAVWLKAKYL
ncbi:MAG: non-canonical purine NTP pyrophosphatase [Candidatus Diapherotrites archaeon]